jgi:hypothetical protein
MDRPADPDTQDLPPVPAASYYERLGPVAYTSTAATQSPWQLDLQHGGPPAALLTREIEKSVADEPLVVGKVEVDFLGPIPQGRCAVAVDVLRPGRQVRQVQALMSFPEHGDRPVVAARAWLFSIEPGRAPATTRATLVPPLPGPQPQRFFAGLDPSWGYGPSIEWRFSTGGFREVGAAQVWTRVRVPLVDDEPTSDLQRMLVVADSTNGISAALPMDRWLSIPPALTVVVRRAPAGEWFMLDAQTSIEAQGTGVAQSTIVDEQGICAHVLQPLLVAPLSPRG